MGALLAIRSQRAIISAVVVFHIIWLFLVINKHTSETPVTDRIRIPDRIKEVQSYFKKPPSPVKPLGGAPSDIDRVIAAASNSTLGFSKILAVHMKHRWDKWDAAVIQSYTSGLDLTYYEAVDGKIDIADAGRVGLPPMNGRYLGAGAIACWRSHANIWSELVRTRGAPVMIFESDAAWDVNLRGIMGTANKNFLEYLAATAPKPIANAPPYTREKTDRPADRGVEYNPNDPWQSEHWDVWTLGHCSEAGNFYKEEENKPRRNYTDPFNVPNPEHPEWNRVLSRSTGWACTTAYAVSHRGAAKLLIRHAMHLNEPIDLIMKKMIDDGELVSYAMHPSPVIQWNYHDGIGMKSGATSDLFRIDNVEEDAKSNVTDTSGWEDALEKKSVWVAAEKFGGKLFNFQKSALWGVWDTLQSKAAQFEMPEVAGVKVGELKKNGEGVAGQEVTPAANVSAEVGGLKRGVRRWVGRLEGVD